MFFITTKPTKQNHRGIRVLCAVLRRQRNRAAMSTTLTVCVEESRHSPPRKRAKQTEKCSPTKCRRSGHKGVSFKEISAPPDYQAKLPSEPRQRLLVGGPGSGKTTELIEAAKKALGNESHVHVISTWEGSRAVSMKIKQELLQTRSAQVHFHDLRLYEDGAVKSIVQHLRHAASVHNICVIVDNAHDGPAFSRLCEELHSLTNLTLLAAARTHNYKPERVLQRSLSDSHRLPRPVLQEMIKADFGRPPGHISTGQSTRSQIKATSADHIRQLDHEGSGHTAQEPKDCQLCGERVSKVLDEWNVGATSSKRRYRHVFVLIRGDTEPFDEERDESEKLVQPAMGLITGMRKSGIPVQVVRRDDDEALSRVATMEGPDVVTVVAEHLVRGLEREVVVWVGVGQGDYYDVYDKWHATSCTKDKVLWVLAPHDVDLDDDDHNGDDDTDDDRF